MNWKKKQLAGSRLYVIIDKEVSKPRPVIELARIIKGLGVDIIQLRDKKSAKSRILKEARELRRVLVNRNVIFMINDYADIAKTAGSEGVHLGQCDIPLKVARQLLGQEKVIGVSCHNLKQAIEAQDKGADYISIGPIFTTPTKPEYKAVGLGLIRKVKKAIHIPFFVIGGINEGNMADVLSSGAKRVAVSGAICRAKDMTHTIKKLSKILDNGNR